MMNTPKRTSSPVLHRRPASPTNRTTPSRGFATGVPTSPTNSRGNTTPTNRTYRVATSNNNTTGTPLMRPATPTRGGSVNTPGGGGVVGAPVYPVRQIPLDGRVEIGLPHDANMTDLMYNIARSLKVPTCDIEVLRTIRGGLTVDFRLKNPTPLVKTPEDLARELAGDEALRASLSQVVTYARESCLSFSVHSTLSHGDCVFLSTNRVFTMLDELAQYLSQSRPMDIRHGAVELLWPELIKDVTTLRAETERLHTELSRAAVNLSASNAQRKEELRSAMIESDVKVQHVNNQYARLSDEYHVLLKDRETTSKTLEERTAMLELEQSKNVELQSLVTKAEEANRVLQQEMQSALQIKDMKIGALLKENETIRKQYSDAMENQRVLEAEVEQLRGKLADILASASPTPNPSMPRASSEAPTSPVPVPQPYNTAPTAVPQQHSTSTNSDIAELQSQIKALTTSLEMQQKEVKEAKGDARCSQDALVVLESELARIRDENRQLKLRQQKS